MKLIQRWKQTALHNKVLVITGFLVALGTLFYAGAAVVQVWILYKSSKEASEQTRGLVNEANRIANSMENNTAQSRNALDRAIEMSKTAERAWIGVVTYQTIQLEAGKPAIIEVGITNTGRTPAIDLHSASVIQIAHVPRDRLRFETVLKPSVKPGSRAVITPSQILKTNVISQFNISPEQLASINRKGELALYVFGTIWYKDVFGNPHSTAYCYIAGGGNQQGQCSEHNDAN